MSENSKIEWTDATWNPILGCSKVSAGCKNCYAIRTAHTKAGHPNAKVKAAFAGLTQIEGGKPNWTGRINFVPDRLDAPLHWKKPRRIFVNSQSDLFHEGVSDEQIDQIFAVMGHCSADWYRCLKTDCEHEPCDENSLQLRKPHTFQVLTKRPARMLAYLTALDRHEQIKRAWNQLGWYFGDHAPINHSPWPLPNVWLGVSCEDQKTADERIPLLLQTPAAIRWVSAEPLLGALKLDHTWLPARSDQPIFSKRQSGFHGQPNGGLHWIVVGGESGPDARPMHPDWARSLRDQCQAASVPFFFKQWGEWLPVMGQRHGLQIHGDKYVFPDAEVMGRVGKRAAGRLLDGQEHNEYPEVSR